MAFNNNMGGFGGGMMGNTQFSNEGHRNNAANMSASQADVQSLVGQSQQISPM
jgi:hypothetical protein